MSVAHDSSEGPTGSSMCVQLPTVMLSNPFSTSFHLQSVVFLTEYLVFSYPCVTLRPTAPRPGTQLVILGTMKPVLVVYGICGYDKSQSTVVLSRRKGTPHLNTISETMITMD